MYPLLSASLRPHAQAQHCDYRDGAQNNETPWAAMLDARNQASTPICLDGAARLINMGPSYRDNQRCLALTPGRVLVRGI